MVGMSFHGFQHSDVHYQMTNSPDWLDGLKTLPQYLIPQHLLSRLMFGLTRLELGKVTQFAIRQFVHHYTVDMSLAQYPDITHYPNFNAFFTRALRTDARPLANTALISPVDGAISQLGRIQKQSLLQAKGHVYDTSSLLGGDNELARLFENGMFCTIYLSPRDYHRIHSPCDLRLTHMRYIPGDLFSVNQRTVRTVPNVFARNERVICLCESAWGKVAIILVGAVFVGSMETVWAGQITPPYAKDIKDWHYPAATAPNLRQGQELGRFNMGSTVIILLEGQRLAWMPHLTAQASINMGQALAQ
jgi:phosphatidylserine decarboxylase